MTATQKEQIQKVLEEAYDNLRTIPVADDNVEKMAVAKDRIRTAYKLIGEAKAEKDKEVDSDGGQNNG